MIHTLELSREISYDTYQKIKKEYNIGKWNATTMFEEQGIPMVKLRVEKGTVSDGHGRQCDKTYYMIYLSINHVKMIDHDPHL